METWTKKIKKIDYVLAVVQGIILEVFKPTEWESATIDNFPEFNYDQPERTAFVGSVVDDQVRELYIRKRVPSKYRKRGAAYPIKYSF
ncbi:MAG: hypothetical protein OCD76_19530 [Reichenbachiella sp.]